MLILKIKYDLEEYLKISIRWLVYKKYNKNVLFILIVFINIVHIAYKHNAPQLIKSINVHPLAIVTAAVDRIG
jgi:hypothetical protein